LRIGGNESAKYRLGVLNDLNDRCMQDVLITCVEWTNRLRRCHNRHLSADKNPAMHHPPDPFLNEVCDNQGHQTFHERSEENLQEGKRYRDTPIRIRLINLTKT